mgnify:CR=1 FL=1
MPGGALTGAEAANFFCKNSPRALGSTRKLVAFLTKNKPQEVQQCGRSWSCAQGNGRAASPLVSVNAAAVTTGAAPPSSLVKGLQNVRGVLQPSLLPLYRNAHGSAGTSPETATIRIAQLWNRHDSNSKDHPFPIHASAAAAQVTAISSHSISSDFACHPPSLLDISDQRLRSFKVCVHYPLLQKR